MLQPSRITLCSRCNAGFQLNSPHFPFTWSDIRANYFPSLSERSQIHRSLDDAAGELERYDQEIERVVGTLRQLEEERERLVGMMEGARALLSPVRRLPSELLLSVFCFLLEPEEYSLAISKFGNAVYSPTFNISRTCTFWRRIVHSNPDLWRSISVDVVGIDAKRRLLNLVYVYLENSRTSPLTIQITDNDFSPDDGLYFNTIGNTGVDVIKALVRHSERWVKVDLRFRQDIFRMLEAGCFQLPHLEELSMQSIPLTTSIRAACAKTSTLQTLKVDSFTYYGIAFPYHTLQDLVVGEIKSCQLFLRMLPLCNNLKTLRVDRFWATRNHGTLSSASPSLPINCILLERLSLTIIHWERLSMFFTSVSLPSLTEIELKLSYEFDKSPWPSEDFIEMIKGSQCSLRRIKLQLCPLSDTYLLELFRLSPELEEFAFEEVTWMTCFTPRLFFILTLSPGPEELPKPPLLLPKLTRLSVHGMKTWDESDMAEIGSTMVESRRNDVLLEREQCSRLEEASLSFYPEVSLVSPAFNAHLSSFRLRVLENDGRL
ncbi:hypothetical protein E1B28_004864 [Marasmius oreades]|uniref:F-box domain-containing protein n=1 Tax=Marasmius oreades TaxID=181124 RepID=A0A9P7UZE9_9AGAR|nr:uncharacterized protein E1B28_004864 [Marasmius oreades]KAG7097521.1 hypothetical protein E1B28_004864 [Marasmius oreades]